MAGSHLDYPGNRLAIGDDGTIGVRVNRAGVSDELDLSLLSTEDAPSVSYWPGAGIGTGTSGYVAVVFPELRDVVGWFLRLTNYTDLSGADFVETSTDTSTGIDGSWTAASVGWVSAGSADPVESSWRDNVNTASPSLRCRGIRFGYTGAISDLLLSHLHVFGENAAPGGLTLYGDVGDERITPAELDWGDVALASTADLRFKVKNTSASLIVEDIVLYLDAPTDASPGLVGQHFLSYDLAESFAASVSINRVEPGDVSGPVILRRVTSASVATGAWALRIRGTAASWSYQGASAAAPVGAEAIDYVLEGDVGVGVPTPVVWWTVPQTAKAGASVSLVGYGMGDTEGASSVTFTNSVGAPVLSSVLDWVGVPPTGDATGDDRAMNKAADHADPVHQRVTVVVPDDAAAPVTSIVVDTG